MPDTIFLPDVNRGMVNTSLKFQENQTSSFRDFVMKTNGIVKKIYYQSVIHDAHAIHVVFVHARK